MQDIPLACPGFARLSANLKAKTSMRPFACSARRASGARPQPCAGRRDRAAAARHMDHFRWVTGCQDPCLRHEATLCSDHLHTEVCRLVGLVSSRSTCGRASHACGRTAFRLVQDLVLHDVPWSCTALHELAWIPASPSLACGWGTVSTGCGRTHSQAWKAVTCASLYCLS